METIAGEKMTTDRNIYRKIDWVMVVCYLLLILFGWINIYASSYEVESANIFSLSQRSGMQMLWMGISMVAAEAACRAGVAFAMIRSTSEATNWLTMVEHMGRSPEAF